MTSNLPHTENDENIDIQNLEDFTKTYSPFICGFMLKNLGLCLNKENFSSNKIISICAILVSPRNNLLLD